MGAWAKHLQEQRRQRGLSATQAFERVYERMGLSPKSRAVYTALDTGPRQPSEEYAAVLAAEFGWPPDVDTEPATATEMPDLAEAVRLLTAELSAMRQEREAWQRGWIAVLRAYKEGRVPVELLDALAPRRPEGAQR